jgi:hypothetical protein
MLLANLTSLGLLLIYPTTSTCLECFAGFITKYPGDIIKTLALCHSIASVTVVDKLINAHDLLCL